MEFRLVKNATNSVILGYLRQLSYPDIRILNSNFNQTLTNIEYLCPTNGRNPIYSSHSILYDLQIGSNEVYYVFASTLSSTLTITYTLMDGSTDIDTYTLYELSDQSYSAVTILTPANVAYAEFVLSPCNSTTKLHIIKNNIYAKYTNVPSLYKYVSKKFPTSTFTDDSIIIAYEDGTILGSDNYSYFIEDDGLLHIYSDFLGDENLTLYYDTLDGVNKYAEPIDVLPITLTAINMSAIEYAVPSTKSPIFIIGDTEYYHAIQLGGNNVPIISETDGVIETYSIGSYPTYNIGRNGVQYLSSSKVIKEIPNFLQRNIIQTTLPIRTKYEEQIINGVNTYKPSQIYDLTVPTVSSGSDIGISIFYDGEVLDNSYIDNIQADEGIITLSTNLENSKLAVTYTTYPFINFGTLYNLGIDGSGTFVLTPTNRYEVIDYTMDTLSIIATEIITDTGINSSYYELTSNDTVLYDSSMLDSGIISICYVGDLVVEVYSVIDEVETLIVSDTGTHSTLSYTHIVFDCDSTVTSYAVKFTPTGTVHIHDYQYMYRSTTEHGFYFVSDYVSPSISAYDILNQTDSIIPLNETYITIGNLEIASNDNTANYEFLELNKRGGGLADDKIIQSTTGYERQVLFPMSHDYGDIANIYNMPLNKHKFIIIKLPLSIIDDIITKYRRLNPTINDIILRQQAVNSVYDDIRKYISVGSYFKIYDMDNNPWPQEHII